MFFRRALPTLVLFAVCGWVAISDQLADAALLAGPDGSGYTAEDTTYRFVPLRGVGNEVVFTGTSPVSLALPFDVSYYGRSYAELYVSPQGALRFTPGDVASVNTVLPSTAAAAPDIAVYWDDFDLRALTHTPTQHGIIGSPSGEVFTHYDDTLGRVIISWENVIPKDDCNLTPEDVCPDEWFANGASFQVHLYANGRLEFHFADTTVADPSLSDGRSATIGIQDASGGTSGANHLLVSYDAAITLQGKGIAFGPQAGGGTAGTAGTGGGTVGSAGTAGSGGTAGSSGTTGTVGTGGGSGLAGSGASAASSGAGTTNGTGGGTLSSTSSSGPVVPPEFEQTRAQAPLPLDRTVTTSLYELSRVLFEGPGASQFDVAPSTIQPARVALLHGRILDATRSPVAGAQVRVHRHPEFGWTTSRADGTYDLAINGGGEFHVVLTSPAHLTVHRKINTFPNETHAVESAVMLRVDAAVTAVDFADPIQVHEATSETDADGTRQLVVMFAQGTQAYMRFPDGTTQPLPEMHVRATEYTVGPDGQARMPAELPPGTIYTYAFEISADEAEAAGAVSVELTAPAVSYMENFLRTPVGSVVPAGSYDRQDSKWNADVGGIVLQIVSVTAGLADLDLNGDGAADPQAELDSLNVTDPEREELALRYPVGTTLWRTPITHFSPHDYNFTGTLPADAVAPPDDAVEENQPQTSPCIRSGSIIECENQVLGQRLDIVGTPFSLNYRSSRVPGAPSRQLRVRATDGALPPALTSVRVEVEVGGRLLSVTQPPKPNQFLDVSWDGKDAFGRVMQGPQPARVCTYYDYTMQPRAASTAANAAQFGEWMTEGVVVPGRHYGQASMAKCYGRGTNTGGALADGGSLNKYNMIRLGGFDAAAGSDGLGGWTLSIHHTLSRETGTVYLGTGETVELSKESLLLARRIAGNVSAGGGSAGPLTGPDPLTVAIGDPSAVALADDGAIYFATPGLVRKLSPDGTVSVLAGTGVPGYGGDNGPAASAQLGRVLPGLAIGRHGTVYIGDASNGAIRAVATDGTIRHFAGAGNTACALDAGLDARYEVPPPGAPPGEPRFLGYATTPDMACLRCLTDIARVGDRIVYTQDCGPDGNRLRRIDGEYVWHLAGWPYPSILDVSKRPIRYAVELFPNALVPPGAIAGWQSSLTRGDSTPGVDLTPRWGVYAGMRSVAQATNDIIIAEEDQIRRLSGHLRTHRVTYSDPLPLPAPPAWCGGAPNCFSMPCSTSGCNWVVDRAPIEYPVLDVAAHAGLLVYTSSNPYSGGVVYDANAKSVMARLMGGGSTLLNGSTVDARPNQVRLQNISDVAVRTKEDIVVADDLGHKLVRLSRYTVPGYVASWASNPEGTERYLFDDEGRHLATRDALTDSLMWTFDYDGEGRLVAVRDAFGRATVIERGAGGQASAIVSPDGLRTTLVHDAQGYLSELANPNDERHVFGYDSSGRMLTMQPPGALPGKTYVFQYDVDGRLIRDTDPSGAYQSLSRVPGATPSEYAVEHETALGRKTRYETRLSQDGGTTRVQIWPDGTRSETLTTSAYDSARTTTARDGTVFIETREQDVRMRTAQFVAKTEIRTPQGLRAVVEQKQEMEKRCRLFVEDCGAGSGNGGPSALLDQFVVKTTVQGDARREHVSTFRRARVEGGTSKPADIVIKSPVGRTATVELDAYGRVVKSRLGTLTDTRFGYDEPDPATPGTSRDLGRLTSVSQGSGLYERKIALEYDAHGFVSTMVDALGRRTAYQRDKAGRVVQQTMPDGRVVEFQYDEDGNLRGITPPRQRPAPASPLPACDDPRTATTHCLSYDAAGRMVGYVPPRGSGSTQEGTTFEYDEDKQLKLVTRPDGTSVSLQYDAARGRLHRILTGRGVYEVAYDGAGRVETMISPDADEVRYTYDGALMTSESWSAPGTATAAGAISRVYNADLSVQSLTVAAGGSANVISLEYDKDGLPTKVGELSLSRDAVTGLMTGTTLGVIASTVGYTPADPAEPRLGEPTVLQHRRGAQTVYEAGYSRDRLGRVQTKVEQRELSPGNLETVARCYTYDAAGRLWKVHGSSSLDAGTRACTGAVVEEYRYDANSNRVYARLEDGTVIDESANPTSVDEQDRLVEWGGVTLTYGGAGDLASKSSASGATTTFEYDELGNLRRVEMPQGDLLEYVIDAKDRRVAKKRNGVMEQGFLYDGSSVVAELDESGNIEAMFVYATRGHVPDYMVRGADRYRMITDLLGSVVAVVHVGTGDVVQQRRYDAWGRIVSESTEPGFSQPFGFAGGLYDRDTGLVRFGARDYDPATGRWTAKDPIGFAGGDVNLYGYVFADPVNWIDPSGLYSWWEFMGDATNFSAGLGDALLMGLGSPLRDAAIGGGGINPCSLSYGAGALVSLTVGVGRMAYAIAAKTYSIVAKSGLAASAFREQLKHIGRIGRGKGWRPVDVAKYDTDDALRAAAGRTNRPLNVWGAGIADAGIHGVGLGEPHL